MLYWIKLCVLVLVTFLAVLVGLLLAFFAWPVGEWGLLNLMMAGYSVVMFASAWYLAGCFAIMKRPTCLGYPNDNSPHTIIGQGEYRKEYRD